MVPPPPWDVIVCGAGPAGLTLGNHLGVLGLKVLIVERLPQLLDYPRGVGIDDESLRSFQAVGLVNAVRRHTVPNQILSFIDRKGRILAAMAPSAQPFGWPRRSGFIQPRLDRELATGLEAHANVTLRFATAMEGFQEANDQVTVSTRLCDAEGNPTGESEQHRARYLVGCDGGRSAVRHALGLPFEGRSESTRWLVIDLANDPVGTLNAAFVLDDDIPHVTMGLPHGLRRYEFMVPEGADEAALETDAHARQMLQRVLPAGVEPCIIRHRVYTHHARIAPAFRKGRALIAGDAAHLMPVWQGQGFNTGIRDVTNLGWKLAMVATGRAGERLLDSYTEERHAHALAMIDLSVLTGRIFVPSHPWLKSVRNLVAPAISKIGPLRRYITEMRFKPMPFFRRGAVVHPAHPDPRSGVGRMFIQPWVAPFNPDDYVTAGLIQKDRAAQSAQATGHVEQARASLEQSRQAEVQARSAVAHNDWRIEKFEEQLRKISAEQALAEEERADEEAEESSIARMVMGRVQSERAGDDARH